MTAISVDPHSEDPARAAPRSQETVEAIQSGIRPALELLLACARASVDAPSTERVRSLAQMNLDWEFLIDAAHQHSLRPLLYRQILTICPDIVPPTVLERLRADFHANAWRNLRLTGELVAIVGTLETHGVAALPYKGPTLAAAAYGDLALREFVDLDILVRTSDVPTAKGVLAARGYWPTVELSGAQEAAMIQSRYELMLVHETDESIVEIQWRITPAYFSTALDVESLWARAGQLTLGNASVRVLAPEDLLMVLCVHGAKHLWERLGWICDIARVISAYPAMDWDELVRRAEAFRIKRMLYLGLFLANRLLGSVLPTTIERSVNAEPNIARLAGQVRNRILDERDLESGIVANALFHLSLRERFWDRVRYCTGLLATPTPGEWSLLALPRPLTPLYYPLRVVRLAAKYGQRLAHPPR